MSHSERRAHERLTLADGGPTLAVGDREYELVDVAERGLRARLASGERLLLGSMLRGTVRYSHEAVAVEGTVVRADAGELAVKFDGPGIDRRVLLEEVRRIEGR